MYAINPKTGKNLSPTGNLHKNTDGRFIPKKVKDLFMKRLCQSCESSRINHVCLYSPLEFEFTSNSFLTILSNLNET